jgi:hypothetical protein
VGRRAEEGEAGILGEVSTSQVVGGIGVVDSKDVGIERARGEIGKGQAVRGTAQGSDVAEIMGELLAICY